MTKGKIGPDYFGYNYQSQRIWSGADRTTPGDTTDHPYSLDLRQYSGVKSRCYQKDGTGNWVTSFLYRTDCNPEIAQASLDSSAAVQRVNAKMTASVRGWNAAVFVSQLPQALNQIGHLSLSVLSAYQAIRKGNVAGATRALLKAGTGKVPWTSKGDRPGYNSIMKMQRKALSLQDPASQWLAFQYGWLPLLSDIHEGTEFVESLANKASMVIRNHAVSKDSYKPASQRLTARREVIVSRIWRLKRAPSNVLLSGVIDPLSVAWELLPFSFVVDWFIPVGQFIENASMMPFLDRTTIASTMYRNRVSVRDITFTQAGAYSLQYWDQGGCTGLVINQVRTVSTSPFAGLTRPSLNATSKAFSSGHFQNAAALLTGLLAKSK